MAYPNRQTPLYGRPRAHAASRPSRQSFAERARAHPELQTIGDRYGFESEYEESDHSSVQYGVEGPSAYGQNVRIPRHPRRPTASSGRDRHVAGPHYQPFNERVGVAPTPVIESRAEALMREHRDLQYEQRRTEQPTQRRSTPRDTRAGSTRRHGGYHPPQASSRPPPSPRAYPEDFPRPLQPRPRGTLPPLRPEYQGRLNAEQDFEAQGRFFKESIRTLHQSTLQKPQNDPAERARASDQRQLNTLVLEYNIWKECRQRQLERNSKYRRLRLQLREAHYGRYATAEEEARCDIEAARTIQQRGGLPPIRYPMNESLRDNIIRIVDKRRVSPTLGSPPQRRQTTPLPAENKGSWFSKLAGIGSGSERSLSSGAIGSMKKAVIDRFSSADDSEPQSFDVHGGHYMELPSDEILPGTAAHFDQHSAGLDMSQYNRRLHPYFTPLNHTIPPVPFLSARNKRRRNFDGSEIPNIE